MAQGQIEALTEALEAQRVLNALLGVTLDNGSLDDKLSRCLDALAGMRRFTDLESAAIILRDGRQRDIVRAVRGRSPAMNDDGEPFIQGGESVPICAGRMTLGHLVFDPPLADTGPMEVFLTEAADLIANLIIREKGYSELRDAKLRADRYSEQIAASERKFRALFDGTPIGVFIHRHLKPLYANRSGLHLMGFDCLEDYLGQEETGACLPPEERETVRAYHEARLAGLPAPDEFEMVVVRRDGTFVSVLNRSFQIEWEGEPAVCTTLVDLTRRKEAEAALVTAKAEAEQANRSKTEFLSSMSHELRTPLNAIIGFAQLLRMSTNEPLSARQKGQVAHIQKAGEHLLSLINGILDLACIETGRSSLSMETVGLRGVVDDCLALTRSMNAAKGQVIVDATEGQDIPSVGADETRLKQVLLNLLSNAVKYNRPEGRVTLRIEPAGDLVRVVVDDTGRGIPEALQADLFQPFCRLGQESSTIEGTGIGLTITKRLIQQMGGDIGFRSVVGEGSSFWVDLPQARAEEAQGENTPAIAQVVTADPAEDGKSQRLLYVEDNPANQVLMEEIVADAGGLRLTIAPTAEQGIEVARSVRPDVIVMDINLLGMDGFQALACLRADPRTADIPVIALSADAMPATVRRGLQAGFHDYLTKPVMIDVLLGAVKAATDSTVRLDAAE